MAGMTLAFRLFLIYHLISTNIYFQNIKILDVQHRRDSNEADILLISMLNCFKLIEY